jgi:hypothetical protein
MGPRLRQIDELNQLGLTPEQEAALLGLPVKTVREYQYRIRQMDGEHRPRGWHGHTRQRERQELSAEHGELHRITSDGTPTAIPAIRLSLDMGSYSGRIQAANPIMGNERRARCPNTIISA